MLHEDGKNSTHFVDSYGFTELSEFTRALEGEKEQEADKAEPEETKDTSGHNVNHSAKQNDMKQEAEQAEQKTHPAFYGHTLSYAVEHGEADKHLESHKIDRECKKAIEETIRQNFDGMHLNHDIVKPLAEQYGSERMAFVLANTLQQESWDGRFSRDNKAWASEFPISENIVHGMDMNRELVVSSHPAVLDGFIDMFRSEVLEQKKELSIGQEKVTSGHNVNQSAKQNDLKSETEQTGMEQQKLEQTLAEQSETEQPERNEPEKLSETPELEDMDDGDEIIDLGDDREQVLAEMKQSLEGKQDTSGHNVNQSAKQNELKLEAETEEMAETELAFQIADRYISIQQTEGGYDYSIMGADYKEIDGGVYDNPDVSIREALNDIVEDLKENPFDNGARGNIRDNDELIPIDYDGLMEKVEAADRIEPQAQGNAVENFKAKTNELFHEISEMNPAEIEETVKCHVQAKLEEYGIDAEIVDVAVTGSRCRGLEREGSDLDVAVELSTNEREDFLFDTFNENGLHIGGVKVDINPITAQRTGSLETYLPHVEDYLEGVREARENEPISIFNIRMNDEERWFKNISGLDADGLCKAYKLDFLSEIVLRGSDERKAYCNNQYGLIEYTLKPFELTISYKNKDGERVKETTGYRELYEVLSYMVKQPYFCDASQKKFYDEEMAKEDRSSLSPVYQEFLAKKDSIRKNREETRKRVIANGWVTAENPDKEASETRRSTEENAVSVTVPEKKHNYHYNLWELPKGGPKTRFGWNVEAIRTLKQIEAGNRLATAEEQKILAKYVGWGGLSQAFDENNESWGSEYAQLKELLSADEYTAARATVNNAFYTSPEIAMCMNQALVQFGFHGGNVLEPSMGIGNFFGSIPTPMQGSSLYGVEIDSISGRIAKQLYQTAKISITGFENTTFPDNFFDVVVGNVPFGDYRLHDPKYNKYNFRIHDYFIAKSLDQVRPGGMVAVITTKGTLDKTNPSIRKYIAERAELVGAVRLPNSAFKDSAGTEVTADILFLQKRERKMEIEPDWVHLGYTENGIAVNSYFAEHPEMMLGHMEYDTGMFGQDSRYTVCVNDDENFNLYEALNNAIRNIKAEMTDFDRAADSEEETKGIIPADPDVRNYTFAFFEGNLYYRENSQMIRQNVSQAAEERIRRLDEIRQVTRELIDIQMQGCSEEELADKQALLNARYDKFVEQYGCITSKANRSAFRDDSDYPLLCSLEEVNEDGEVKKADMFYKQTIKAKAVIDRVETAVEALNVSVNEYGAVNLPYMLSIYEPDISGAREKLAQETGQEPGEIGFSEDLEAELKRAVLIEELEGLIFQNPDSFNENNPNAGWETADEYLSGNVRDKLRLAKAMSGEHPVFSVNVAALEKVQPVDIDAADIDVRIGTTWIEPEDYEQFIYELLNTPRRARAVRSEWYNSGMINPVITKKSGAYQTEEGCLSLEGVRTTTRYQEIEVEYFDASWKKQKQKYSGWIAQIIQHECDHLEGIII